MKNLILVFIVLLVLTGGWLGRAAWQAHRQIVSLNVHNAPLAQVLRKIERQVWKKIEAEQSLDARITLRVKDKPLAYVLDRIAQQAGAHWAAVYAVYASKGALGQLTGAFQGDGKLEPAGWIQIAPKASSQELAEPDPDATHAMRGPGSDLGSQASYRPGRVMFTRTLDGQEVVQGRNNVTEIWSPEELVIQSSLKARLGGDEPAKASVTTAAETARKVQGKWTTCYALHKSMMGIGFAGHRTMGRGMDPRKQNDRFARLTPEQRVLQARQRL